MRLIDADALMPKLKFILEAENQIYRRESWGFTAKCINAVEDAPTIEERKTGKWVGAIEYCEHLEETTGERYQPSSLAGMIYCNQCWKASDRRSNYCRECGAKMEEGDTP